MTTLNGSRTLGNHIRDRLTILTQHEAQVASAVGVSQASFSAWVCGKSMPTSRYLRPLAKWLGVTEIQLLSWMFDAPIEDELVKRLDDHAARLARLEARSARPS